MFKNLLSLLTVASMATAGIAAPVNVPAEVNYCVPTGGLHSGRNSFVQTITSTGGSTHLNYSASACPSTLLTYAGSIDAQPGNDIEVHFVAKNLGSYSETTVRQDLRYNVAYAFIDWNQDGILSRSEYQPWAGQTSAEGIHNVGGNFDVLDITKTIHIPEDAESGSYRVRVAYTNAWESRSSLPATACGTIKEGIVYDFDINVEAGPRYYVVNIEESERGTVTVKNGIENVVSGTEIEEGTVLTAEAAPLEGYVLSSFIINGLQIEGNEFTVSGATNVGAQFSRAPISYGMPTGTQQEAGNSYVKRIETTGAETELAYATETNPNELYKHIGTVSVEQGNSFDINFIANNLGEYDEVTVYQDLRFNVAVMFIDWNLDGILDASEMTRIAGKMASEGIHNVGGNRDILDFTHTIAAPRGIESTNYRARVIYTNAWTNLEALESIAYGPVKDGVVYDFDINVLDRSVTDYQIGIVTPENGTVTLTNGADDVIENNSWVLTGTEITVETAPAEGYELAEIRVNETPITGNTFTVEENCMVEALFALKRYTINYSHKGSGSISVVAQDNAVTSGSEVEHGTEVTLTVRAEEFNVVKSVIVNGEDVTEAIAAVDYTYTMPVTFDVAIQVTFEYERFYLTYEEPANGTLSVSLIDPEEIELTQGDELYPGDILKIKATPAVDYHIAKLLVNGEEVTPDENGEYLHTAAGSVHVTTEFEQANSVRETIAGSLKAYIANDVLYIEGVKTGEKVEVYNLVGKKAIETLYNGAPVAAGELASGIYIVKAGELTCKVTKK